MKRFLLVTLASFCLDIVWALTVIETSARHVWPAAFLSVLLVFVSGFITLEYIKEPRLLVAVAVGSFCGTVVALSVIP